MSRNVPSIEELLAKKRAESGIGKPRFLSKKERQQLALERRQAKVDEMRKEEQKAETVRHKRSPDHIDPPTNTESLPKKKKKKPSKFNFEWDETEDTLNRDDYLVPHLTETQRERQAASKRDYLPPSKHWSQKTLQEMEPRDWRIFNEDMGIHIKGTASRDIHPLRSWQESEMPSQVVDIITRRLKYRDPTPIQRASVPIALGKRDMIGVAETGSGKTLAYLLPILCGLLALPRLNAVTKGDGPYGLILVPTRELAQQIEVELNKFLKFFPEIQILSIVGGKLIETNLLDLQNKAIEIIIATPGRLIDCLERHFLVLNQLHYLVLDECDRMIEMNFGEQVAKIKDFMTTTTGEIQNMLFTATMTKDVEMLSKKYVDKPVTVHVGSVPWLENNINDRIEQKFEFFATYDDTKKQRKLEQILTKFTPPIIVFINYKETGEKLLQYLTSRNFKVALIHGSKSQDQREAALQHLKDGTVDILIGTNVASRGIDVNNVSLVVNYQMPKKIDDYIHRVGRTGRAGNVGTAITFLSEQDDAEIYPELKKLLKKSGNRIPEQFAKIGVQTTWDL